MGTFAGVVNALYVLAGLALFTTGEAPVIVPGVDFLGDKFAMAWAGWKFAGCLYMSLVNLGVPLARASAVTMLIYIAVDVFAVRDTAHWATPSYGFILLEAVTAIAAMRGNLRVGGVINALYVLAGLALFTTGEAPVIVPGVDFLGDKFAMAWAGWKFAGCLYYSLVNLDVHTDLAMAISMVPYVCFDCFALYDKSHWTSLAAGFIVLDGAMAGLGLTAYLNGAKGVKTRKA